MQGHRNVGGSFPEAFEFDYGSSSSNPAIEQELCWGRMRKPTEHGLPNFNLLPGESGTTYPDSVSREGQTTRRCNIVGVGSNNGQNEAGLTEIIDENVWTELGNSIVGWNPRLEERDHKPNTFFSWSNDNVNTNTNQILNGSAFMQNSSAIVTPQGFNLNTESVGHIDDDYQVIESRSPYSSSGLMDRQITPTHRVSDSSGSGGYLVDGNESRPGSSLDGCRLPRKRKTLEVGQSSRSGSSRVSQLAKSTRGLSISCPSESISGPSPLEHVNPELGLGVGSSASARNHNLQMPRISQRNVRVRIIPPCPQDSISMNSVAGCTYQNFDVSSNQQSSRIQQVNHPIPMDFHLPTAAYNLHQSQPAATHIPALPQNLQSIRWNGASNFRHDTTSSSTTPVERNMSRHMLGHSLVIPVTGLRNSTRNTTSRTLAGGSRNIPVNAASSSRNSSSSLSRMPRQNASSQLSRRSSELVRRSLISSAGSDFGEQNSSHSLLHSRALASSQEAVISSGANNLGNHHTNPMLALWMERQADVARRAPSSLRTSPTNGRNMLVSEIRDVFELMRRSEGLRFQDALLLEQQMLLGVAGVHDRHRDMRLDVDNMSYEELLALEERIGNVSTGLSEEVILKYLKRRKFVPIPKEAQSEQEPCSICQEEYNDTEDLGVLKCGHDFHAECVQQWLTIKNVCPICKTTGIIT